MMYDMMYTFGERGKTITLIKNIYFVIAVLVLDTIINVDSYCEH